MDEIYAICKELLTGELTCEEAWDGFEEAVRSSKDPDRVVTVIATAILNSPRSGPKDQT